MNNPEMLEEQVKAEDQPKMEPKTLNQWAADIHLNAVEHGWWDTERSEQEILALIHSECSEALEEYRNHKPMVYQVTCKDGVHLSLLLTVNDFRPDTKPEGVCIELIDMCIRIFDYLGRQVTKIEAVSDSVKKLIESTRLTVVGKLGPLDRVKPENYPEPLPETVADLHWWISATRSVASVEQKTSLLLTAAGIAFLFIRGKGYDPEELMRIKHEYNKTRPYRHGGKAC